MLLRVQQHCPSLVVQKGRHQSLPQLQTQPTWLLGYQERLHLHPKQQLRQ
jgi:hypothetical protein